MDAHIMSNRGKVVTLDVSREIHYVLSNQGYLLPRDLVNTMDPGVANRSTCSKPTHSEVLQRYKPLKVRHTSTYSRS